MESLKQHGNVHGRTKQQRQQQQKCVQFCKRCTKIQKLSWLQEELFRLLEWPLKKELKYGFPLLFFNNTSAAQNYSLVPQTSFSFLFLFHASISSSCSCLLFLLLTLIYQFSTEMGFINHCNAALGKTVLSAGRNTLQLTATAGRKTLTSQWSFGDRLLMALGYFMSAFMPSGAGPRGLPPVPPVQYFKLPSTGKNKLLGGSQGKRRRKNCQRKGRGGRTGGDGSLSSRFCTTASF